MSISLADLPLEILLLVCTNMDTHTLLMVGSTCKRLQFITRLNYLWEPRYYTLYPDSLATETKSLALASPTFWRDQVYSRNKIQAKYNQVADQLLSSSNHFVSIASAYLIPLTQAAYKDKSIIPACLETKTPLYMVGTQNSFSKAFINLALSESLGRLLYYQFILDNKSDPLNLDLFQYLAYEFGYFGYHYYIKFINFVHQCIKSYVVPLSNFKTPSFTTKLQRLHQYITALLLVENANDDVLSFYPRDERARCFESPQDSMNGNSPRFIAVLMGKLAQSQGFVVRYVYAHPREIFVQIEQHNPESDSKKVLFYHANMMRIRHPQEVQSMLLSHRRKNNEPNDIEYSNLKVALVGSVNCLYRCSHNPREPGEEYLPSRLCTAMSAASLVFDVNKPTSQYYHPLTFYPIELPFLKQNIPFPTNDNNDKNEPKYVASPYSLTPWASQIIKLPYGFSDTRYHFGIGSLVATSETDIGVITCFLRSKSSSSSSPQHKSYNIPEAAVVINLSTTTAHVYRLRGLRKLLPEIAFNYRLPLNPWIGQYFANIELDCLDPTFNLSGWWIKRLS